MSDSSKAHRQAAREHEASRRVDCAVLTISDTRTLETDTGGGLTVELLEAAGHGVAERSLVRDDAGTIRERLLDFCADPRIAAIITTGGTGIANRDTTIDVVRGLITVELEGFGELFRMLSYEEVGAAAMLSRATAGLICAGGDSARETFIFALPGSTNAVGLALRKLVIPELSHLVWERRGK